MILRAIFGPMPGTRVRVFSSSSVTARRTVSGWWTERIARARRGPTPLAVMSTSNTSRSSRSAKP